MKFFNRFQLALMIILFVTSCSSANNDAKPFTEKEFARGTELNLQTLLDNQGNDKLIYDSGVITNSKELSFDLLQSNIQKVGFKLDAYTGEIIFAYVCEGSGSIAFQHSIDLAISDASGRDISDEMYDKHNGFPLTTLKSKKCGSSLEWVARSSEFGRKIGKLDLIFFPSGNVKKFRFIVAIK